MPAKKTMCRIMIMVVAVALIFALGLVGCNQNQMDETPNNQDNADMNNQNNGGITGTYDRERVTTLEEAIEELDEVDNAYAVLSSDTAWIAITLDGASNMGTTPQGTGNDANGLTTPNAPDTNVGTTGTTNNSTPLTDTNNMTNGVTNGDTVTVPEDVRNEIVQITQKMYPEITTVHVTADATLVGRIQNIAQDLAANTGKTLEDFADDLTDIGNQIVR